ncbi:PQQ-dependent sugar dehydrogenase [Marinobacter daepoensis]|uniref:PQQ-dependent sugar dehydrogenase n=1 Tax=Marinobacter daepoensis TaxID=262077 RepID=A0ABS3BI00_9GAMM|nr:PQQ-dependent sugar dehydrogenase [Marinobacter daepoensis]MBN7771377.1 PQQ-dependent sugar dehydrogenase [Marinobacter daepoensis]MBY6079978.1 PQQ-dependent sugar dehydrogenase [Marinobacter daepoensis]
MKRSIALLVLWAVTTTSPALGEQSFSSRHHDFRLETIAEGLEHPWSLAFLPDGALLVTERAGRLRMIGQDHRVSAPVAGLPDLVASGQGGLLDVQLHPDFDNNRLLFLSYAHKNRQGMTTRVARAVFDGTALNKVEVIFEALPRSGTSRHFAGRMAFDGSGNLYIAVGDRGEMDRAQDTGDDAGGVHRITLNGAPAEGNPFLSRPGFNDTLFSYGNRNIQGMTPHPETGEIWSHEHGPRGGDEINVLSAGHNYGWPMVTYGIDYSGLPISGKTTMTGVTDPLHYWDPSIAPSGMAFYSGERFPQWRNDLFVGALKQQKLVRLKLDGETVTEEEDLLTGLGERIRDVRMGPDGALWLLTDSSDGKLYRLAPAD